MAKRQLARSVHLFDDKGRRHVFVPGDEVPEWAAKRIKNPAAWADDDKSSASADVDDAPADDEQDDTTEAETEDDTATEAEETEGSDDDSDDEVPEPPRSGKGSGKEPWAAYATAIGVDFPEDASVKEIRDAVDAHKSA